jgi:hypothetical protein
MKAAEYRIQAFVHMKPLSRHHQKSSHLSSSTFAGCPPEAVVFLIALVPTLPAPPLVALLAPEPVRAPAPLVFVELALSALGSAPKLSQKSCRSTGAAPCPPVWPGARRPCSLRPSGSTKRLRCSAVRLAPRIAPSDIVCEKFWAAL